MLPRISHPDDSKTPAEELFARKPAPAHQEARSIGFYSAGCLAGGAALPISGPAWQVMRLSRNRNWGHPALIRFLENLALKVRKAEIWNGLLISDMSQPHGGPMSTGHASHQIGLDADIWLTPMPKRELSLAEREEMMSTNVVAQDRLDVDPTKWMPRHGALIKAAALDAQVERIFVNPAIKKTLCRETTGDRTWLRKVRPWWGHDYHFHVRLLCPTDSAECKPQDPPPPGDGCDKDLDWWFTDEGLHPKPGPEKPLTMARLPPACRAVLAEP
jgi:penicillin-insensitive murein endopeptidase